MVILEAVDPREIIMDLVKKRGIITTKDFPQASSKSRIKCMVDLEADGRIIYWHFRKQTFVSLPNRGIFIPAEEIRKHVPDRRFHRKDPSADIGDDERRERDRRKRNARSGKQAKKYWEENLDKYFKKIRIGHSLRCDGCNIDSRGHRKLLLDVLCQLCRNVQCEVEVEADE